MDEESNKRLGWLIMQLANGNIWVLEEIADLMEKLLMSIGNIYYRNKADVEDAIQNLYIRLYEKAKYFKKNGNACAWIVKIYKNLIKSYFRKQKSEENFITICKADFNTIDEIYLENHLFLREVFDRLTDEEQQLFIYYYWCKASMGDISKILHKPKSTISYKLNKLDEKLKKLLK